MILSTLALKAISVAFFQAGRAHIRASLLDGLARDGRDVSGEIARANFAAVSARTPAALDALIREIRSDHDSSYARL